MSLLRTIPVLESMTREFGGQPSNLSWNLFRRLCRTVTLIQPPHRHEKFYSKTFPPRHCWLDGSALAVGWANTVCICKISLKTDVSDTIYACIKEIYCFAGSHRVSPKARRDHISMGAVGHAHRWDFFCSSRRQSERAME